MKTGTCNRCCDSFAKDLIGSEKHEDNRETITKMLHKTVEIDVRCIDNESMKDVVDLTKIVKMPIQYE